MKSKNELIHDSSNRSAKSFFVSTRHTFVRGFGDMSLGVFIIAALIISSIWCLDVLAGPRPGVKDRDHWETKESLSARIDVNKPDRMIQTSPGNLILDPAFGASVTEGNGGVNETIVQTDGKIISVGTFYRANGLRFNGIVRLNSDGTVDPSFSGAGTGANGEVRAVALQSDGKIVIAGNFLSFDGHPVTRIVRLNQDGGFDQSFTGPSFNNQLLDVAIQSDGKILVSGSFTGDSPMRGRITRLNDDGTVDSTFNPGGTGANGDVYKILIEPNNKILLGGSFTSFNGAGVPRMIRLTSDGVPDTPLNTTTTPNGAIRNIVRQPDGKLLIGGSFQIYGNSTMDGLARLNPDGSLEASFDFTVDPNAWANVNSFALMDDGKIVVSYWDSNHHELSKLIKLNADGTVDQTFVAGTLERSSVRNFAAQSDGSLLVSGDFVSYNSINAIHLFRIGAGGVVDSTFNPVLSTTATVFAVKQQTDGKILIGGDFEFVNGVRRTAVARLNADGTLDSGFDMGRSIDGDVYALAIETGGTVVIGGSYIGNGSFLGGNVSRINSDGSFGLNLNFDTRFTEIAYALDLQKDGKILVGGVIHDATFINRLVATRLNSDGSLDTSFNVPTMSNGAIRAILVQPSGKIIVGGNFFSTANFPRQGIARLNVDGSLDTGFSEGTPIVYSLARSSGGQVVSGGSSLRRYSVDGVVDSTLNIGTGNDGLIRTVIIQSDGKILVGGQTSVYNGTSVSNLFQVQENGLLDPGFDIGAGVSSAVMCMAFQSDSKLLVGGLLTDFNGSAAYGLLRLKDSPGRKAPFDFDGDGKTDLSIFRPNGATGSEWWYLKSSNGGNFATQFGSPTDKLVAVDYTGDGKADIAFWRPSTGEWFILRSEDSSFYAFPFGTSGDVPAPADYDGDGKADAAVFRPSTSTWFVQRSSGGTTIQQFGSAGDLPVAGDYDGDGKADIAIFRPNGATGSEWWILRSTAGLIATQFGTPTDKAFAGDFTGDGRADMAFWRPSTGMWYILRSEDLNFYAFPFGANGDVPVPGDYDGDGKTDAAVFRPSNSTWYLLRSTAGTIIQQFGAAGDVPVPSEFVR